MKSDAAEAIAGLRARVYRFILKLVRDRDGAEDLTQRSLLTALETFKTFRRDAALSTWVIGIALNHVRNHRRRLAGDRRFVGEEALQAIPADDVPVSDQVEHRSSLRRLQAEIDRLPEEFREAIVLVALEELTYEDASAAAGVPIGTIRSRVFRAREMLRAALARN